MRRAKRKAARKVARRRKVRAAVRRKAVRRKVVRRRVRRTVTRRRVAKAASKKSTKKSAKKKAAKKKAAKKAAKPIKVTFGPSDPLGSRKDRLNRDHADQIYWHNKDNQTHWVVFEPGEWPFAWPQHRIEVLKKKDSETLTVRSDADVTQYDYDIDPPVVHAPGTPPDGPAVIIDED